MGDKASSKSMARMIWEYKWAQHQRHKSLYWEYTKDREAGRFFLLLWLRKALMSKVVSVAVLELYVLNELKDGAALSCCKEANGILKQMTILLPV